ncbi:MAG: cupin domain-containing protein [Proteobacteria bacterium]|nr:cupin domain-containing protein [Pseudomonadota bacterium]
MGANDAATCINLTDAITFSAEARTNRELMTSSVAEVRMNCYEPGQVTPMHMHPGEDEVMYIVEGRGSVVIDGRDDLPIAQGQLVRLPSDQFHSIVAAPDSRMVLIYFMKPGYGSVRPDNSPSAIAVERLHGERA